MRRYKVGLSCIRVKNHRIPAKSLKGQFTRNFHILLVTKYFASCNSNVCTMCTQRQYKYVLSTAVYNVQAYYGVPRNRTVDT